MKQLYRHDDEELRKLALDVLNGNVLFSFQIPQEDVPLHFLPLMFLTQEQKKDWETEGADAVYEYMAKALPTGVNGLPVFSSFHVIHREDLVKLRAYLEEARQLQNNFLVGKMED